MKSETNLVKFETSMGNIVLELNAQAAPVTVKNFLGYVEDGFYDGTIFHRVIPGFMIQGGGFTKEMQKKQTRDPIVNEASNGLGNERGTIAMARTSDPDSATCQFFINHNNNMPLNYASASNPGYAVFGKVTEGMDTVDAIASTKTTTRGGYQNVPVTPILIKSATVVSK
jgi:peptidyl-prolyl cis-trans isomerase A (cyclophilin A)